MSDQITVMDVLRSMKIEITPALSWSVGAKVRERYRALTTRDPEKELRKKTDGAGSHCFAVYPETMRPEIERIIRDHATTAAAQASLF